MSRAEEVKLYRTFVKGLITEASYLTYPEDSSIDELNTIPSRKGNRTRRFGVDFEDNYQIVDIDIQDSDSINEFVWKAANNQTEKNFLCLQIGSVIYFFNLISDPISDSLENYTIDLASFSATGASSGQIKTNDVQFSSGKGFLFIAHPYCEPLVVEYDQVNNGLTVTKVIIQIRDFEGLNDSLANDEEPSVLTKEHQYNLMNQGWVTPSNQTPPGGITPTNTPVYTNPNTGDTLPYDRYGLL